MEDLITSQYGFRDIGLLKILAKIDGLFEKW